MLNEIRQGIEYLLELSTETRNGFPIWVWVLLVFAAVIVYLILDSAIDPEPEDEVARQLWLQRKQENWRNF